MEDLNNEKVFHTFYTIKMENISLDNINPSNLKYFFRKLSIINSRHTNKDKIYMVKKERKLQAKVHRLEEDLHKTRKERDLALRENRNKINELNDALISMKATIHKLLEDKKHRIRHLERKIRKEVKFR